MRRRAGPSSPPTWAQGLRAPDRTIDVTGSEYEALFALPPAAPVVARARR